MRNVIHALILLASLESNAQSAEDYCELGRKKMGHNLSQEAITCFDNAIKLNPAYRDAYFLRGYVKSTELHDYKEALKDCDKVIEIDPKFFEGYGLRGVVNFNSGNCKNAITDYNNAIDINPQIWELYLQRADAKSKLNNYKEALQDYSKVIGFDPRNDKAYTGRGKMKLFLKDTLGALLDFNTAVDLNPKNAQAYFHRALAKGNNYNDAIADFNKGLELDPGNNAAQNILAALREVKNAGDELKATGDALKEFNKLSSKSLEIKGNSFLEKNGQRKEVIKTSSGLQYEIIEAGYGQKPQVSDKVKFNCKGTFIDGKIFYNEITEGSLAVFVKGVAEGLQLMNAGSKYKFYIPNWLGYGMSDTPTVPGGSVIIFEIELLSVKK